MTITSLKLLQLKNASDLKDVARIWNRAPAELSYALFHIPPEKKYTEFTVPKKSGGDRTIAAPIGNLKRFQKLLANDLAEIEKILEDSRTINPEDKPPRKPRVLSHGFKPKLSIMTNGQNHRRRRYVFNIDLKDFFPSINFGRVYGFFVKNKDFQLKPKVAAVLAQIACHNNQLPQGSPCSPVISNLIASVLDIRLNKLASRHHCTYTRYADDISFSTNEQLFPQAIAKAVTGTLDKWDAGDALVSEIERAGFTLNHAKTRMQLRHSRQDVTGLVVNKKVNIPVDYYAATAAMCDHLFKSGKCHIKVNGQETPFATHKLRGRLAYIFQVRGMGPKVDEPAKIRDETEEEDATPKKKKRKHQGEPRPSRLWASFRLYERFLDFATLYSAPRTILLCEGITDNIHLKTALHGLAARYPSLINLSEKPAVKVNFFRYTKTTAVVQQLSGGSGQLSKLTRTYSSRVKGFKVPSKHPLILIADFDEGSDELFKIIKERTKKSVDGSESFYHLERNLYVVPLPRQGGKDTAIEDLYEKTVLDTKLDGKSFDRSGKEKDATKFYSKAAFASKVVAAGKATIKFDNFKPVFDAIVAVETDYAARLAGTPPAPTASAAAA